MLNRRIFIVSSLDNGDWVPSSKLPEWLALLLFEHYGLQIGDPLLQLPDDEILLAEAIRDTGIPSW